jgi:hypothetical protein
MVHGSRFYFQETVKEVREILSGEDAEITLPVLVKGRHPDSDALRRVVREVGWSEMVVEKLGEGIGVGEDLVFELGGEGVPEVSFFCSGLI